MNKLFEQPKRLSEVLYQRSLPKLKAMVIFYLWLYAGVGFFGFIFRLRIGKPIPPFDGFLLTLIALFPIGLALWGARYKMMRRYYIEFRKGGLFMTGRGVVARHRFVSWVLTPDSLEPRYTRLRLGYKYWWIKQHFSMLLDDPAQISDLRHELSLQIPQKEAA